MKPRQLSFHIQRPQMYPKHLIQDLLYPIEPAKQMIQSAMEKEERPRWIFFYFLVNGKGHCGTVAFMFCMFLRSMAVLCNNELQGTSITGK